RLYGERAALFAGIGAALYLPLSFFEMKVLGTTLGLALALAALLLLVGAEQADAADAGRAGPRRRGPHGPAERGRGAARPAAGRWLAAGIAIGVTALCTPAAVLLAAIYGVALLARRRPRPALALAAGTFAALLPALAHNVATGNWILISSQGG